LNTSDILKEPKHHPNNTIILSSSSPPTNTHNPISILSSDHDHPKKKNIQNETQINTLRNNTIDATFQQQQEQQKYKQYKQSVVDTSMMKSKNRKQKIPKVTKPIATKVSRVSKVSKVSKAPISATASKNSESLRRLKREWKDAVQLGVAYDWSKMKSVTANTSPPQQRQQTQIVRKTVQSYSNGRQTTTTTTSTFTQYTSSNANTSNPHYLRLGPIRGNLLRWHFSYTGPPGPKSPYATGIYHGCILLPKDYPLSPPRIQVLTPNGRFLPGKDICLTASQYHPESWTPRWTVLALVNALRLHMLTTENEIGGMRKSFEQRQKLAELSRRWKIRRGNLNVDHGTMVPLFFQSETSLALEDSNHHPNKNHDENNDENDHPIIMNETKESNVMKHNHHDAPLAIQKDKEVPSSLTNESITEDESLEAYSDSETYIDLDTQDESSISPTKPKLSSSPQTTKSSSKHSKKHSKRTYSTIPKGKVKKTRKSSSIHNSKHSPLKTYSHPPDGARKTKHIRSNMFQSFGNWIQNPRRIMLLMFFTMLTLWNPLESFFA